MPRSKQKLGDPAPGSPLNADGTPKHTLESTVLAYVRQGAYPHVAAEAAGVLPATWAAWTDPKKTRFAAFRTKLAQAVAQARVRAEISAFDQKPLVWLRNGPGRERPDSPGWSSPVAPVLQSTTQINVLASPEWNRLWATLLRALADFPDARAAMADALASFDAPVRSTARPLDAPPPDADTSSPPP